MTREGEGQAVTTPGGDADRGVKATTSAQLDDTTPLTTTGSTREYLTSSAPTAAPTNMLSTDAPRRPARRLLPPASGESAASPVRVNVRTVVVRSGSAMVRTVAFLTPMASAVSTITPYAVRSVARVPAAATSAAASSSTASTAKAVATQRCCGPAARRAASLPPATAPARNAPSDTAERGMESPGAPATAKARNTTFPVMFAVNTC